MRLFICEKPSQAADIAKHVGARQSGNGARTGPGVTVTWCIGHLLEQSPPEHYDPELARWAIERLPVVPEQWQMAIKTSTKAQFAVVAKLIKQATEVVVATDADSEGEVIAREVMQLCGYRGPVRRLWLGALDDASVKKALDKLLPGEKTYPLYLRGLGRQRADWLAGMNLTMALTKAFGGGGKGGVVHCGRVQTPVLALVVRRERAIRNFVPKPYFVLQTLWQIAGTPVPMRWETPAEKLDQEGHCIDGQYVQAVANKVLRKSGRLTHVERADKSEQAPLAYSLGALQKEASARYGMGAQQVLSIAQSLYEKHKATTYPRTDCEYLPESMTAEIEAVFAALKAADPGIAKLLAMADTTQPSRVFNDKRITAHHAIIPTTNSSVRLADMTAQERLLYDLIRRRYIAQFLGWYKYQETKIKGVCEGETFTATGKVPLQLGWKRAYLDLQEHAKATSKSKPKDAEDDEAQGDVALPSVSVGDQIINVKAEALKTHTKPPKRYTEGTLIAAMESIDKEIEDPRLKKIMQGKEKAGIGTDATRGAILDGLLKRGYFDKQGKNVVPTERGEQLVSIVEAACPHMADPVLTALWEDQLAKVEGGEITLEKFESQLATWLRMQIEKIKAMAAAQSQKPLAIAQASTAKSSQPAGQAGAAAQRGSTNPSSSTSQQSPSGSAAAHPCPSCGKPLKQRSGPKGTFWGCSGFPGCKATLPYDGRQSGPASNSFRRQ